MNKGQDNTTRAYPPSPHSEILAYLDQQIDNLTSAIASMGLSEALSDRLRATERERAAVQGKLSADPALLKLPEGISALMRRYPALLDDLPNTLKRDTSEARKALGTFWETSS